MKRFADELSQSVKEGISEISHRISRIKEIDKSMGATIYNDIYENWRDAPKGGGHDIPRSSSKAA